MNWRDILRLRGRIVLFTQSAQVGLRFEQAAERDGVPVIHTRGWADRYGPLGQWKRIHDAREYGVLSCDCRYAVKTLIPGTDFVWVGTTGNPLTEPTLWHLWQRAMEMPANPEVRRWRLDEDQL